MTIPIFWRLILGTMGILFLSAAACLYSVIQLGTLSQTARAALDVDQRMIGYEEALTDALLSEVRYGGRFIFTHSEDRHEQFRQFKNDFTRYMTELKSLAQSEELATSLSRVDQFHRQYHELFDREVEYIRAKQTYAQSRYQQERDKVLESALAELERLKTLLKANLHHKLEGIDQAASTSRRIGLFTTLLVTLLGTVFSLKISKSIAAPLKQLELSSGGESWTSLQASGQTDQSQKGFTGSVVAPLLQRINALTGNVVNSLSRRLTLLKASWGGKASNQ
jgi:hypothetical protein